MTLGTLRNVLRRVRGPSAGSKSAGVSDAALLERFERGDEAAFELLVWRHGPLVLGACRRVLRHEQDAEDAFQATFLTLARRAGSVGRRGSLAGWLYTVAHRVALRARERQAARGRREGPLEVEPPQGGAGPAEDLAQRELGPLIEGEVAKLPEKYRAAFVLCHFEGKTNEEAAALLGCPKGTILSRLSRARERLRRRLAARDVALAAAPVVAALAGLARPLGEVSPVLVTSTAHAAILFAAGKAALAAATAPALELAEGMVHSLVAARLRLAAATLAVLVLLGFGAGFAYSRMPVFSNHPDIGTSGGACSCHGGP